MITAQGKLIVLDDFQVDWTLPKFQKKTKATGRSKTSSSATNVIHDLADSGDESDERTSSDDFEVVSDGVAWIRGSNSITVNAVPLVAKRSFFSRLAFWRRDPEPKLSLTVEEFFSSVKHSQQELVVVKERAAGYERAMANAAASGQKALFEKLSAGLNAYRMETQLVALGMTKYVEEASVVEFYKQCKKGLRLDYVRNFTRIIPEDVVAKKVRADELGIFDNYAVLHYDPQARAFAETEAEKAARKDPILFGLMRDRTQLYVVGDWVDETCDLTLDQFAEVVGKEAVKSFEEKGHPYR